MISATQRIQPDCGYHKQVYTCNTESYSLTTLWCCIEKTIFFVYLGKQTDCEKSGSGQSFCSILK